MDLLRDEASAGMAVRPLSRFYPSPCGGARRKLVCVQHFRTDGRVFIAWAKKEDCCAVVLYSGALAILNKLPVYLYRNLGDLHNLGRHADGMLTNNQETEVPNSQAPTTNHESRASDPRLLRGRTGPVFASRKEASAG